MVEGITVYGELRGYAYKLRSDGIDGVQIRFEIPSEHYSEQLSDLKEMVKEYCSFDVNAGYNTGDGSEHHLAGIFNDYKFKPRNGGDLWEIGFLVPVEHYGETLGNLVTGKVPGKDCRVIVKIADGQEPFPWGVDKRQTSAEGDSEEGQMELDDESEEDEDE